MICPDCGAEYVEGRTRCADCGADLVDPRVAASVAASGAPDSTGTLPPPAHLVAVLTSTDVGLLLVAESALRSAGIPFVSERNDTIDLFGAGRIGGVNPITGLPRILVAQADLADAEAVLAGVTGDAERQR